MGVVMMMPWNMLINVNYFWDYKFRNTSMDDATVSNSSSAVPPPTKLQKEFTSYLSIASNVPNAVFVILHALLGHLVGMRLRVLGSQVGQMIVFACITILALVDSDSWQKTFLAVNLSAIALMNVFNAVFQGSVMANLANFPEKYIGHMSSGQGMGGLLPSVVNVIILAFPNSNSQLAGFYCFLFALILAGVCLALSCTLTKSPYYTLHSSLDLLRESETFDLRRDLPLYLRVLRGAWAYHAVAVLGLLAVSNGYLTTISFMFGPKVVEGQRLSEMTAAFLVAFILIGCSLGSVISTPLVRLL